MAEQEERIAQRLRKLRADLGDPKRPGKPLPVEDAADKAKIRPRQWQRWESGKTFPRSANLERVAATFGFDVSEFYETDDEPGEPTQLDRIEAMVTDLHVLFFGGEDEEPEDGLAARLLGPDGSPPRKGAGGQRTPRAAPRPRSA